MNLFRGWIGERKTSINLWFSLSSKYKRYHNIIVPSTSGTTQIDHLLVSPYGLFIVETKNKKGWIFGSEDHSSWTQVLFHKKYTFQNPIHQTYRQRRVLSSFLQIDESLVHTIVYFVGDCKFKTPLPENVLRSGLGIYIKSFNTPIIYPEEIRRITANLECHIDESNLTQKDHLRSLRRRHASNTTCPWCGSQLVKRRSEKGSNVGSVFLGCEAFPKCRFTKNL